MLNEGSKCRVLKKQIWLEHLILLCKIQNELLGVQSYVQKFQIGTKTFIIFFSATYLLIMLLTLDSRVNILFTTSFSLSMKVPNDLYHDLWLDTVKLQLQLRYKMQKKKKKKKRKGKCKEILWYKSLFSVKIDFLNPCRVWNNAIDPYVKFRLLLLDGKSQNMYTIIDSRLTHMFMWSFSV